MTLPTRQKQNRVKCLSSLLFLANSPLLSLVINVENEGKKTQGLLRKLSWQMQTKILVKKKK